MKEESPEMESSSIVYAEYVRLSEAAEKLMNSSFEDFKLLAVIGAILGLKPVADSLSGGEVRAPYLFVGFLGLLFVIAIIAFRDTLKQSLIVYLGQHLKRYEQVLKERVPVAAGARLFRTYSDYDEWLKKRHIKLVIAFNLFFVLPVVIIPSFILWHARPNGLLYSLFYLCSSLFVYALHFFLGKVYLSKPLD